MTAEYQEHTEQGARKKGTPFLVEVDLRDFFAAKAMQGMLASWGSHYVEDIREIAENAYSMADAMLAAREK